MKKTDKFLIGIVVGIVILIVAAFIITFTRPQATYQAEDTPQGVAHNYLLALEKHEYERAYQYLSPTLKGYPDSPSKFASDIENNAYRFRFEKATRLQVLTTEKFTDKTVVKVQKSYFRSGGLFDSEQSITTFEVDLMLEEGNWRIVDANQYFAWCWKQETGCK